MKRRESAAIAVILIVSSMGLFIGLTEEADAAILKVGDGEKFSTIEAAIKAASDGDTIKVLSGTYHENIVVDKKIGLIGEGSAKTIIVGDGSDDVISVSSPWANISALRVTTNNIGSNAGINIDSGVDNVRIENCNLSNNYYGVYAYGSSSSIIDNLVIMNTTANLTEYGFYLKYCDDAFIHNNTASYNDDYGLYFYYCDYGKVQNNTFDHSPYGLRPYYSDYSIFANNSMKGNNYGIYSYYSDYSELHNNEVKNNNDWGIYVYNSDNHRVENNTIVDSGYPYSDTGDFGLEVYSSTNVWVKNNTFTGCGAYMDQSTSTDWNSLIVEDNTVNSNDIVFYRSKSGVTVPSGTGQVILYDCNDIDIDGLDLSNATVGVQAYASWAIEVSNCDLGYNYYGIEIDDPSTDMVNNKIIDSYFNHTKDTAIRMYTSSEDAASNIIDGNYITDGDVGIEMDVSSSTTDSGYYNKIRNNTIISMTDYGIDVEYIGYSNISNNIVMYADDGIYFSTGSSSKNHHCTIENNTVVGGGYGIRSYYNYDSTIKNNTIKDTETYGIYCNYFDDSDLGDNYIENVDGRGIYITGSDRSLFHNNNIINATEAGIYISSGGSNSFRYNSMTNCGFFISSTSTTYWSSNVIDTTNSVNGKDVVVIYNVNNPTIPSSAGQVMLHTTNNVRIDGLELSGASVGIWIYNSDYATIENCVIENVSTGLDVDECLNIRIMNNTIANATDYGLYLDDSDGTHLFNNTFMDCGYPYHEEGLYGSYLYYCNNLNVENNSFERCGVYIYGSSTTSYYTTHTFSNNTVNDRELAYINGQSSKVLSGDYGQILIINSDHITVEDQNLSLATIGIQSTKSTNINISNVSTDLNYRGIYFDPNGDSDHNRFENITSCYNREEGLYFSSSSSEQADHLLLTNSTFSFNGDDGADLYYVTDYALVENNTFEGNVDYGLRVYGSSSSNAEFTNITCNVMKANEDQGAYFYYMTNSVVDNNTFSDNLDYGVDLHYGDGCILENNTASGNSLDGIYVYDSDDVDVLSNHAEENGDDGIYVYKGLQSSFNGEIAWNNISKNDGYGLNLQSDYHGIHNNTLFKNVEYGLYCSGTYGDDNEILDNVFIENNGGDVQALDNERNNDWDDGKNGNYWSDHQTPDKDRNGIVDTAYAIPGTATSRDNYPLVIGNIAPLITTTDLLDASPTKLYSNDYDATDLEKDTLAWSFKSNATFLSIVSGTGVLSGTPTMADASKTFWVNVTVSDGNGGSDWSNFTLSVDSGNTDPVITTKDVTSVDEDTTYSVDYDADDKDGDKLTWYLDTNAGFLSIDSSSGLLTGSPLNRDVGSYLVDVSVNDGNGGLDSTAFTLTVNNVNDDPEITTDPSTLGTEDVLYSVDFEADDVDPTSDILTWSLDTDADFLSIIASTGVVSGTPGDSGVGTWYVNVTVGDGNGGLDWLNYSLMIRNVNDDPVITNPITSTYDWDEDDYGEIDFDATDIDPTSDTLTWSVLTDADWIDIDPTTGILSGIPTNAKVGDWLVNVSVSDGQGGSDWNEFTITVVNTNDAPSINSVNLEDAIEDELFWYIFVGYDMDPTDDVLTWSLDSNAGFLSIDPDTGNLSGTPENDDVGTWWINVSVSDGNGGSTFRNLTMTVLNVNDAPEIVTDSLPDSTEDEEYWIILNATDMDPTDDVLTWSIKESSAEFITLDPATGNLSFTPLNDEVGSYWIVFEVSDGNGGSDEVNLTLNVMNVNDAPEIISDYLPDATEDEEYWFVLNGTDPDPTMDTLTWTITETNSMFLSLDATTGNLSGTPTNDDVGTWWINISLDDGLEGMVWWNATITVNNVNDGPELNQTEVTLTLEEDSGSVTLDLNDVFTDPDGDSLSFGYNAGENFTISIVDGVATITPAQDFTGTETIEFSATDGDVTLKLNITIDVEEVNDAPYGVEIDHESSYVEGMDQIVSATATDPDGDDLTFTWTSNLTGSIGTGPEINLSLSPGTHTITLNVTDSAGGWVEGTFVVTIEEKEVDKPAGGDEDDDFPWWIIIVVILLILVILIILFIVLRKKKEEEPAGEAPPAGETAPMYDQAPSVDTGVVAPAGGYQGYEETPQQPVYPEETAPVAEQPMDYGGITAPEQQQTVDYGGQPEQSMYEQAPVEQHHLPVEEPMAPPEPEQPPMQEPVTPPEPVDEPVSVEEPVAPAEPASEPVAESAPQMPPEPPAAPPVPPVPKPPE